jgi:excisionase family DNA binding protein
MKTQKMFYSISEVAEMLGVGVQAVTRLIHDGKLRAMKIGRIYRIAKSDFNNAFVDSTTGDSFQTSVQQIPISLIRKPAKQVNFEMEIDKYNWIRQYRYQTRLRMRDIMNECIEDFIRKQGNKQAGYVGKIEQTINGKYSLLD